MLRVLFSLTTWFCSNEPAVPEVVQATNGDATLRPVPFVPPATVALATANPVVSANDTPNTVDAVLWSQNVPKSKPLFS